MNHLQWLDISHNLIHELDFDAFKNTRDLQVIWLQNLIFVYTYIHLYVCMHKQIQLIFFCVLNLKLIYLSYNYLTDIPQEVFKSVKALRVADFSHNHLRGLPDNLFYNGGMEK